MEENIDECKTVDKLIASAMFDEFDIDEETAKRDVQNFTTELITMGMVIEE